MYGIATQRLKNLRDELCILTDVATCDLAQMSNLDLVRHAQPVIPPERSPVNAEKTNCGRNKENVEDANLV